MTTTGVTVLDVTVSPCSRWPPDGAGLALGLPHPLLAQRTSTSSPLLLRGIRLPIERRVAVPLDCFCLDGFMTYMQHELVPFWTLGLALWLGALVREAGCRADSRSSARHAVRDKRRVQRRLIRVAAVARRTEERLDATLGKPEEARTHNGCGTRSEKIHHGGPPFFGSPTMFHAFASFRK